MEVLKVRHILDNILSNLRYGWFAQDNLNLLLALNLLDEYAHRELNLDHKIEHITRVLLNNNLKNFSPETIRSNFTLFWKTIELNKFNETFFIDNYDLIDHEKLKMLKKKCVTFDHTNMYVDVFPVCTMRNFSEKFHKLFPLFERLKVCYNYDCYNETEVLGQLCPKCKKNKCPRCREVIPDLKLDNWGCCEECAGCSQYDD